MHLPRALLLTLPILLSPTHASPSPPLLTSDFAISLAPHNTLFLRQVSDLQTFAPALAAMAAAPITNSGIPDRPFAVAGDSFPDFDSAAQRSCDVQFQACQEVANAAGGGGGEGKGRGRVTVEKCERQKEKCLAAQQAATVRDFDAPVASTNIGPDPLFPDFDLICEG